MFWLRLKLCMDCMCNPLTEGSRDQNKYSEFASDRATAVKVVKSDVDKDYVIGDVLGEGAFGLVKQGIHRTTMKKVALKFVDREKLSERDEQLVFREAGIMTGLSHGNVVEMYGFYKSSKAYCLALEFMAGGELLDDILRRNFYSEACARRITLQILDALTFLHRRGIVHRDVKPENLLLPRVGCDDVKLADFGFATILKPPTYKVVDPVGTPGYAAPELLRLLPYDGKVDVFSAGVIAYVLLAVKEVVLKTLAGHVPCDDIQWKATSEDAKNFVRSLLSVSPTARPAAHEALSHPWMKANGQLLRSNSLSDEGSGSFQEQLQELQKQRQTAKSNMKGLVGAVMAATRLKKLLEARGGVDEKLPLDSGEETSTVDLRSDAGSSETTDGSGNPPFYTDTNSPPS